jgi:hypothetical protein
MARGAASIAGMAALALIAATRPGSADDHDRHAGYYYPPATATESYTTSVTEMAGANRVRRIGFVTILTAKALSAAYAPPYIIFVKGAEAEKMIIIGMGGYVDNVYKARALLAQLTAQARTTEIFKQTDPDQRLTFLDLLRMLGFDQVTLSDGRNYTLQIKLK